MGLSTAAASLLIIFLLHLKLFLLLFALLALLFWLLVCVVCQASASTPSINTCSRWDISMTIYSNLIRILIIQQTHFLLLFIGLVRKSNKKKTKWLCNCSYQIHSSLISSGCDPTLSSENSKFVKYFFSQIIYIYIKIHLHQTSYSNWRISTQFSLFFFSFFSFLICNNKTSFLFLIMKW